MNPFHNTPKEKIIVVGAALLCVLVLFLSYFQSTRDVKIDALEVPVAQDIKFDQTAFSSVKLSAKAAIVYDPTTGQTIFEHNADNSLPLASLTKVMTAITAASLEPEYQVVKISPDFLRAEGDSGLVVDEEWRLKDLLQFSLTNSSNDAARAVASVVGSTLANSNSFDVGRKSFVESMNQKALEIGLEKTFFANENGLDTNAVSGGAYGSARDVALLFAFAIKNFPTLMSATANSSVNFMTGENNNHVATNTNTIIDKIPGAIASKTGYTDLAGGNLAIAFDPVMGRPIVIAVLGSTLNGRFTDVETLISATRNFYKQ